MNDDDILEMMHSTFINKKTSSNEAYTFDEFYIVVAAFNNKWESSLDSIELYFVEIPTKSF
jgi:hypothetical protein